MRQGKFLLNTKTFPLTAPKRELNPGSPRRALKVQGTEDKSYEASQSLWSVWSAWLVHASIVLFPSTDTRH